MIRIDATFLTYEDKEFTIQGKKVVSRQLSVKLDGEAKTYKSANVSDKLSSSFFGQFNAGDEVTLLANSKVIKAMTRKYNEDEVSRETDIESYIIVGCEILE